MSSSEGKPNSLSAESSPYAAFDTGSCPEWEAERKGGLTDTAF